MIDYFESLISILVKPKHGGGIAFGHDLAEDLEGVETEQWSIARALNASFLIALSGKSHSASERAKNFLSRMLDSFEWGDAAEFYIKGMNLIRRELESLCETDSLFLGRLRSLSKWVGNRERPKNEAQTIEKIWSVFFPEGIGINEKRERQIEALRKKRTVNISRLNSSPISDPSQEILFTSNVLLTVPSPSKPVDTLPFSEDLKERISQARSKPQLFWYDHPIQIGIEPEKNEVLYGLKGLDGAVEFERLRGSVAPDARLTCVLSVSVTHRGMQDIVRTYLKEELFMAGRLKNIDIYVFTEADTQCIINTVLVPAAEYYLGRNDAWELLQVFGVDGEYGRHYSFLKAIAPLWQIFIDPHIRATFKIDLDQVFPQQELVEYSGESAFQHLTTPLWGAQGKDFKGRSLQLGMIAGALVNQSDVCRSLFVPDVPFPDRPLAPDEYVFFSALPQALSTEAEMMTRYITKYLDGQKRCIQRVHVTGGTNGILIDSLRRHRPFTPSFIGRAEDQAYLLSVFDHSDERLAYVHKDGLIMRHDKEEFAFDAIKAGEIDKILGDYIRIIFFSSYADIITDQVQVLKEDFDPFTGCFISSVPTTVVYLRFALKAASFFEDGRCETGLKLIKSGVRRIRDALNFVDGDNSATGRQYEKERLGWDLYYETLSAVEEALNSTDSFAPELVKTTEDIFERCAITGIES